MAHGGKRNGAGRKGGGKNKKTAEVAQKAAAEGITPVQVMLNVMRRLYDAQEWKAAAEIARDAAPYCHPRLSAVQHSGPDGGPIREEHELVIIDPNANQSNPSPPVAGPPGPETIPA